MGRWGGNLVTRGRWDPQGFAAQTPEFVTGSDGGAVRFGYAGQRTADVAAGISIDDVRWLCRYLGRVTDAQLRDALTASGATPEDTGQFTAGYPRSHQSADPRGRIPARAREVPRGDCGVMSLFGRRSLTR